jgi:glycosyltransferase involved in cell wall biosynthesis
MLLGSRQENLPQTATEAASCGTPVIAFNVGGLPDIVSHGKTGFLIEPFDTESMARAIETILHKPSLRPAMGQKSRKKAEQHWSEKAVSAQYREIFLEASLSKPDRVGRG